MHPVAETGLQHPEAAGGREEGVRRSITDVRDSGLRCSHWLVVPLDLVEGLPPIVLAVAR